MLRWNVKRLSAILSSLVFLYAPNGIVARLATELPRHADDESLGSDQTRNRGVFVNAIRGFDIVDPRTQIAYSSIESNEIIGLDQLLDDENLLIQVRMSSAWLLWTRMAVPLMSLFSSGSNRGRVEVTYDDMQQIYPIPSAMGGINGVNFAFEIPATMGIHNIRATAYNARGQVVDTVSRLFEIVDKTPTSPPTATPPTPPTRPVFDTFYLIDTDNPINNIGRTVITNETTIYTEFEGTKLSMYVTARMDVRLIRFQYVEEINNQSTVIATTQPWPFALNGQDETTGIAKPVSYLATLGTKRISMKAYNGQNVVIGETSLKFYIA